MNKHIIVYRNCFTGDTSGGDMHMSGLIAWILKMKPEYKVSLVRPFDDGQEKAYPETKRIQTLGYKDTKFHRSLAIMYALRVMLTLSKVKPLSESSSPILIASSHFLPDVLPVYFAGKKNLMRFVYIHHIIRDMPRQKSLNSVLANFQERITFWFIKKRFNGVIVVNETVKERLRTLGFDQDILVSSNFIDVPAAKPLPLKDRSATLVFCGRLVKQKGVYDFITICEAMQNKHGNDFRAIMIGAGPERDRIEKILQDKKLHVELTGFIEDKQKFEYLKKSKLFVFPSIEEGWGIAIAEALGVGTPVIAYDLPVYKSIFQNSIQVIPPGNTLGLGEMVHEKLTLYAKKPEAYLDHSTQIQQFAKRFTIDKVADNEFEFLTRIDDES